VWNAQKSKVSIPDQTRRFAWTTDGVDTKVGAMDRLIVQIDPFLSIQVRLTLTNMCPTNANRVDTADELGALRILGYGGN
jgi:hypothetical protein